MSVVLRAHKLAKTFRIGFWRKKVVALRDATFDVNEHEVFGLIGPNGAGKTTTLKILTGLVKPDAGEGSLLGQPIGSVDARRHLGYLPEAPYFYEYLTVGELLHFYGGIFGMSRAERQKRIDELIEKVGLSHARDRPLRKFSKGMLQRAGLAQALIHDPQLVILDEPQTGLDPIGRTQVTRLIMELREQGKSVFFASHILPDVERVCDRVAVMFNGKVVGVGRLSELLKAQVLDVEILAEGLGAESRPEFEQLGCSWRDVDGEGGRVMLVAEDVKVGREAMSLVLQRGGAVRGYNERHEHLEDLFVRQANSEQEGAAATSGASGGA
ncbi:MAG: ABC transporter [Myxococcales bacterium]|nr:ABC transporter [Myxococcales bacterium]